MPGAGSVPSGAKPAGGNQPAVFRCSPGATRQPGCDQDRDPGLLLRRAGHQADPGRYDVLDLTAGTGAYTMAATAPTPPHGTMTQGWPSRRHTSPSTWSSRRGRNPWPASPVAVGLPVQELEEPRCGQRPVPHSRAVNDARKFEFAYNAAPPSTHRDPEEELVRLGRQVSVLKAEAADRERKLGRLRDLLPGLESGDAGQQRELQDAIYKLLVGSRKLGQHKPPLPQHTSASPPSWTARTPQDRTPPGSKPCEKARCH